MMMDLGSYLQENQFFGRRVVTYVQQRYTGKADTEILQGIETSFLPTLREVLPNITLAELLDGLASAKAIQADDWLQLAMAEAGRRSEDAQSVVAVRVPAIFGNVAKFYAALRQDYSQTLLRTMSDTVRPLDPENPVIPFPNSKPKPL